MKTKKEGQITLFIILGIVILLIVALLFYIANYIFEKKEAKGVAEGEKAPFDITPIKEYVTTCLDNTAKDGLLLLGKQGGYIYTSQGGPIVDYLPMREGRFFVKYTNDFVSYNVYAPTYDIGIYYSNPPNYPWKRFPYAYGTLTDQTFQGNFGLSALPPLREGDGQNSIQEQLKTYITNNIKKCINDFDVFTEQGFEIKEEKLSADVTIAKTDITANLDYPLEIKKISTGEVTEISDFYATIDERLNDLYNFTKEMITNDITDITFDIDKPANDVNQFSVNIVKDVDANNQGDDLIIVKDKASLIKGQPYEYHFARHNRIPALHYISPVTTTFHPLETISEGDITTNPQAYDPDEDTGLIFKFDPEGDASSLPLTIDGYYTYLCNNNNKITITASVEDEKGLKDYQDIDVPCLPSP